MSVGGREGKGERVRESVCVCGRVRERGIETERERESEWEKF